MLIQILNEKYRVLNTKDSSAYYRVPHVAYVKMYHILNISVSPLFQQFLYQILCFFHSKSISLKLKRLDFSVQPQFSVTPLFRILFLLFINHRSLLL